MIFFVSFYDKHPFDKHPFDKHPSKSYNLSYSSKYPYSLTVTGPSAIIESNSGNNFSHNWVFFWSHIKKKKFRTKQIVARAWLNVSAARHFYGKYPSMRSQNTRNNFTTGSKSNVEMVITLMKETLLFRICLGSFF